MKDACVPYTSNNVMGIDDALIRAARHFDFEWGDVYYRDDVGQWECRHGNDEGCICGKPSPAKWVDNWGAALLFIAQHEAAARLKSAIPVTRGDRVICQCGSLVLQPGPDAMGVAVCENCKRVYRWRF